MRVLNLDRVSKTYDEFKAVNEVSFDLGEGKMFGLLGPNGAGKTTTMRMIMNIIIPDSGSIRIFGDTFKERFKNLIGYLPEERGLYPKMKLLDHLQFLGEMKGLSAFDARTLSLAWLERFDLTNRINRKVQELSKGLQQKVQFIATVMHSPKLLILDEPFAGLDPVNTKFVKDILLDLKKQGTTIILSTHLMDQAERLCEEICLINRGNVVLKGNLKQIKREYSHNSVILEYSSNGPGLQSLPMIESIDDYGNYMELRLKDGITSAELFKTLANMDIEVQRF
ncbi:MAG: ATP-binding cassette domain-containing protein, partial [Aliifodinibius sp.]|nr:ATP-binding cassette domain-containing protein [Fodinibius sp.]